VLPPVAVTTTKALFSNIVRPVISLWCLLFVTALCFSSEGSIYKSVTATVNKQQIMFYQILFLRIGAYSWCIADSVWCLVPYGDGSGTNSRCLETSLLIMLVAETQVNRKL